jgi:DNA primase
MRRGGPRTPADEAAFRAAVEEVRHRHNISDVVSKWAPVKRAGRELVSLCLFHSERTPSMRVNDAHGIFYCFGCGASGDIIELVMMKLGCRFMEALNWLGGANLPHIDPAERILRAERDEATRLREIEDAKRFWSECVSAAGTPAEVYARSRAIVAPLPDSIRFGELPAWRNPESGEWTRPIPAMVCACFDRAGEVVGIQRIFLRDGGRAKARMRKPKLTLGRIRGASLRLGPPQATVIVCEGPEDGLSLAQELPGRSVWPTLGTGLMPAVEYPPEVSEIIIAGQNDKAGVAAAEKAGEALLKQGFAVRTMFPHPDFKDWNDELRGIRRDG